MQFANRFAHKGEEEAPVAAYLADIAAASLMWPLGDRGLASGCTASAARSSCCGATRTSCSVPGSIERVGRRRR